jgi:pyruvate dehydrogenase E1 component alpha subunit
MAMLWNLPVIFICENNNYAMGTSVERTTNVTDIYKMACSYEMPSEQVDGMSCEAVHEALERTADLARKGKGPYFLELKTYRYKGHSMSDPAKYRSKEELENYKKVDPVEVIREALISKKYMSEADVEALEEQIDAEVDAAVEFADNSPFPDPSELYTDVYTEEYPFIIE